MFPWLYVWAPQFHFPFSGAVEQDISPTTDWFFGGIRPGSGDAQLEQAVFDEVASYGKQLGILTDTVLWLAAGGAPESAPPALQQLQALQQRIEALKSRHRDDTAAQAEILLESLARTQPDKLKELLGRYAAERGHA